MLKFIGFFQTLDAFLISAGIVTLVLEEDGTIVDTEEFFQSLDDNTHFMVLEKGQKWTQVSADLFCLTEIEVDGRMSVAAKIVGKEMRKKTSTKEGNVSTL